MNDTEANRTQLLEIDIAEYHAATDRISSTGLHYIHRSPAHYYAAYLDPKRIIKPPTPAMMMGTYIHCAILEPERFGTKYCCLDDVSVLLELSAAGVKNPRNTNKYRDWLEAFKRDNVDKELIPSEDYRTVTGVFNSISANPYVAELLAGAATEKAVLFTDPASGVACKIRPDALNTDLSDRSIILELKTCENASAAVFGNHARANGYHNQAAFYVDGLVASGFARQTPLHVFLAIEREPPYAHALYYTPDTVIELGRQENAVDLQTYKLCRETNTWPGYPEEVMPLQFPVWALKP